MATFAANSSFKNNLFKRGFFKSAKAGQNKLAEIISNQKWYYFTPESIAEYAKYVDAAVDIKTDDQYLEVVKDDFKFYFKINDTNNGYHFVYAQRDPAIELYEGFQYDELIKILINNEAFIFTMQNGRPVCIETTP